MQIHFLFVVKNKFQFNRAKNIVYMLVELNRKDIYQM